MGRGTLFPAHLFSPTPDNRLTITHDFAQQFDGQLRIASRH